MIQSNQKITSKLNNRLRSDDLDVLEEEQSGETTGILNVNSKDSKNIVTPFQNIRMKISKKHVVTKRKDPSPPPQQNNDVQYFSERSKKNDQSSQKEL